MKIVLIGSGGREHALAKKLSQSDKVENITVIPGNGGISEVADCIPIEWNDVAELADHIAIMSPDIVLIGSEETLAAGIVDTLAKRGIRAFGPTRAAARIESSKVFAKGLMTKYGIPTAKYRSFRTLRSAIAGLSEFTAPYVIKADGLAAGKGVVIAETKETAEQAIHDMLVEQSFGAAGKEIVIEEFMTGEEASLLAFVDGEHVVPMIAVQDHKRLQNGDQGPNTGGMGTFAPARVLHPEWYEQAVREILEPTAKAMVAEGCPFRGILYAGLMLTMEGPKVVEFNCRFGDPETQVLMPLMESDLAEIMEQILAGQIEKVDLRWRDDFAVCVVAASVGYPQRTYRGDEITGIEEARKQGAMVYHAGTRKADNKYYTDGGRVLNIVGIKPTLQEAKEAAYEALACIHFDGMQYRTDIADKGIVREKA